jgi:outer membrane usher protein FimD/PapC
MKSQALRNGVLGLALAAMPAWAHHAFAAEYSLEQPVTIKGTLTKLEWVNPHGWIYVEVRGDDGKVTSWAVEFGAPNTLLRQGLRKADFPVGTPVVVKGYRAKDGSATANGTTVTLPDGRSLYVGSSSAQAAEKASGATQ